MSTEVPVKLSAVAVGGSIVISGLHRLPPLVLVMLAALQLAAVVVLAYAELRRQRQSLAGALRLVEAMGVVAVITVGKNGELHVDPVQGEPAADQPLRGWDG